MDGDQSCHEQFQKCSPLALSKDEPIDKFCFDIAIVTVKLGSDVAQYCKKQAGVL